MARMVALQDKKEEAGVIILNLDRLVSGGTRNLDVAAAMLPFGYDEVKWAEGQGVLAELVSEEGTGDSVSLASRWYQEAVATARTALMTQPRLLTQLGVVETVFS